MSKTLWRWPRKSRKLRRLGRKVEFIQKTFATSQDFSLIIINRKVIVKTVRKPLQEK